MSLWKKEFCPFCGAKIGLLNYRNQEGIAVCPTCFAKADLDIESFKLLDIETLSQCYEKRRQDLELFQQFRVTNEVKIGVFKGYYIREDANLGVWYVSNSKKPTNPTLFRHEELAHFELLEDGNSVASGGLARAAVGGVLFGGVGAVVGAVTGSKTSKKVITSLEVAIVLNTPYRKKISISCMGVDSKVKSGSMAYNQHMKEAHDLMMFLHGIKARASAPTNTNAASSPSSAADELLKFKNLLDMGAITKDEYQAKKKQLLGI
ncbi:MAG: SHOCT domain-containing protein [Akkermansia sp.]|nr:SHOCT domain-containing protein [Akkermansia sp.]